jgi:hypothetical protein
MPINTVMPLRTLSHILWQERQLIGQVERGASDRFLLHAVELDRAVVLHSVAATLDLDHDVPLRVLAERVPAPWDDVFESHHAALTAARDDVLPRSLVDFLR